MDDTPENRERSGSDGGNGSEGGNASVWRQSSQYLLPSTFEERGAAIPFTTPILANARIRQDWRGRLELMVNHFTDSAGHYIIPWDSIPQVIALTAHDRILHQEVRDRKALDPFAVRRAVLAVAKTGLAGPEAEATAKRLINDDEEDEAQHQVLLILQIIRNVEKSAADELIRQVMTKEGQERIRAKMAAIGDTLGVNEVDFDEKLLELGRSTSAIGANWNPKPGYLRRRLKRLIDFKDSVAAWGQESLGEAPEQATFCAMVAQHTIKIASTVLSSFDLIIDQPLVALADMDNVTRLVGRLGWLVDGWEFIVDSWLENIDKRQRASILADIVSILPIVPRKESDENNDFVVMSDYNFSGRRWVKPHTDWRTGELDEELVHRLEGIKAFMQ